MKMNIKQKLNRQLSQMARTIQVESSSFLVWGEVELPEFLRDELQSNSVDKKEDCSKVD